VIVTLKEPRTSQGFIDRCLVAAEAYHVPSTIVFNKTDIYKKKEWETFEKLQRLYVDIGYAVYKISMKTFEGLDELKRLLQDKITLFYGHSGTGKSTFINYLLPQLELRTKEVSNWSGKGMHTTTFAEMFDLPFQGKIIDTPGIREFAINDMYRYELSHYFPEMRTVLQECRFNNCLHIEEPGCAVKKAVEEGKIYPERYVSYHNILETIVEEDY
jgi:ribosome biogenesis GTPase